MDYGVVPIVSPGYHKFFKGNHDDYPFYIRDSHNNHIPHPSDLGDFGCLQVYPNIFFVRGANSIDKNLRTAGIDWFTEEELTYEQCVQCVNQYTINRPDIVLSHDGPQIIVERWFGIQEKSRTRQLLQSMLNIHTPKVWVFGHHHQRREQLIGQTVFVCLGELETFCVTP